MRVTSPWCELCMKLLVDMIHAIINGLKGGKGVAEGVGRVTRIDHLKR